MDKIQVTTFLGQGRRGEQSKTKVRNYAMTSTPTSPRLDLLLLVFASPLEDFVAIEAGCVVEGRGFLAPLARAADAAVGAKSRLWARVE